MIVSYEREEGMRDGEKDGEMWIVGMRVVT